MWSGPKNSCGHTTWVVHKMRSESERATSGHLGGKEPVLQAPTGPRLGLCRFHYPEDTLTTCRPESCEAGAGVHQHRQGGPHPVPGADRGGTSTRGPCVSNAAGRPPAGTTTACSLSRVRTTLLVWMNHSTSFTALGLTGGGWIFPWRHLQSPSRGPAYNNLMRKSEPRCPRHPCMANAPSFANPGPLCMSLMSCSST